MKKKHRRNLNVFTMIFFGTIILCTFLGRTIEYYMTPKVEVVSPEFDSLKETAYVPALVNYLDSCELKLEYLQDYSIKVIESNAILKRTVTRGDVIAKCEIEESFFDDMNNMSLEIDNKNAQLLTFCNDIEQEIINYEKQKINCQDMIDDYEDEIVRLNKKISSKNSSYTNNRIQMQIDAVSEKLDLELRKQNTIQSQIDNLNNGFYMGKSVDILQSQLNDIQLLYENTMKEYESIKEIIAPVDGIIVKTPTLNSILSSQLPYVVIAEGQELLFKANINKENIGYEQLTQSYFSVSLEGHELKVYINGISENADNQVFDIELVTEDLGCFNIIPYGTEVQVKISINHSEKGLVVPISAIKGNAGNEYVYVINSQRGFWGEYSSVQKVMVSVKDTTVSYAIISSSFQDKSVVTAYDRPIEDGDKVVIVG